MMVEIGGEGMKRVMSGLAALVLVLCTGIPVFAKGAEWKALNEEAVSLYKQGNYERAVTVAKKALQIAEQEVGPDHPDVATSLNNLAELYCVQGRYAQAEPLSSARWRSGRRPSARIIRMWPRA